MAPSGSFEVLPVSTFFAISIGKNSRKLAAIEWLTLSVKKLLAVECEG